MNGKRKTILFFLLLLSAAVNGFSRPEVLYFQVKGSVAQPVTVRTNQGSFSFIDSYTFRPNGHVSRVEAFDAHGNRIVNTQPQKKNLHYGTGSEPDEYWYVFSAVYSSDSGPQSSSSYSGSSSSSGTSRSFETFRNLNGIASYSDDANNFQIRAGFGKLLGENATVKFCFSGMFIEGGVGKNFFSKKEQSFRWTAGAGARLVIDDFGDASLGVDAYGDKSKNWGIVVNAGATWWIDDGSFGLYGNLGLGLPYEPTIIFDVENPFVDCQLGITFRF